MARFCDEATGTGEKEKENRAKRLAFRGRYVVDIHFKQLRCAFTITLYWPAKQFIPKAGSVSYLYKKPIGESCDVESEAIDSQRVP